MKKVFTTFFVSIILLTFGAFYVSAISSQSEMIYKSSPAIYNESEFAEVEKAISNDSILKKNNVATSLQKSKSAEQVEQPYKLYTINDPMFLSKLSDSKAVNKILQNDYEWIVPTDENTTIRVDKIDNQWEVIGYSEAVETNTDRIDFKKVEAKTSVSSNIKNAELKKSVCFEIPNYHTEFVYLSDSKNNYLIPFSSRPDLTGLNNGQLYTVEKAQKILESHFGTENVKPDENGGGAGVISQEQNTKNDNRSTYIIIAISLIVIVSLGFLIFRVFKKKKIS